MYIIQVPLFDFEAFITEPPAKVPNGHVIWGKKKGIYPIRIW